jgi:hypothetical protein
VTWLGLFIIGVKRPEHYSDIRARKFKLLIQFGNPEKGRKMAFVAEHK